MCIPTAKLPHSVSVGIPAPAGYIKADMYESEQPAHKNPLSVGKERKRATSIFNPQGRQ